MKYLEVLGGLNMSTLNINERWSKLNDEQGIALFVFSFIEVSFFMYEIICLMLWLIFPWLNRKNSLIAFQLKIGIILQKVAIPLDVVSFYKRCGRTREGKRSCLIIVDNWRKTYQIWFLGILMKRWNLQLVRLHLLIFDK